MRPSALVVAMCVLTPAFADAQGGFRWPENPKNLKVLPDSVRGQRLGEVMRGFAISLGVDCAHCHVGQGDLATFDFASDEKAAKTKARLMIRMVRAINSTYLAGLDVPEANRTSVSCTTCHRGAPRPQMIEDLLEEVIDSAGIDVGIARYHALRQEFYGGFTYDFSRGPLTALGEKLARREKLQESIRVFELELATNGDDIRALMALGSVRLRNGDRVDAQASFDKALALAPVNMRPLLQQQIDRLLKP